MEICIQVWKLFLSQQMQLNGHTAFFQILLHMDHIGQNCHAH